MFVLRLLAGALGFGIALVTCAIEFVVGYDRQGLPRRFTRRLARLALPAARVRLDVRGIERMDATRPCVFVANHQSFLDYAILGAIYPERTVVLGRANLARMPIVGWLYRATGNLLVDRADPDSRRAAIGAMVRAVREGRSVWVFPEGTRNAIPGTLLRFHGGAFRVATETGVPVVPIVVEPLAPRTDLRARRLEARTLIVHVLQPVMPNGMDARALACIVRERMLEALATA